MQHLVRLKQTKYFKYRYQTFCENTVYKIAMSVASGPWKSTHHGEVCDLEIGKWCQTVIVYGLVW